MHHCLQKVTAACAILHNTGKQKDLAINCLLTHIAAKEHHCFFSVVMYLISFIHGRILHPSKCDDSVNSYKQQNICPSLELFLLLVLHFRVNGRFYKSDLLFWFWEVLKPIATKHFCISGNKMWYFPPPS